MRFRETLERMISRWIHPAGKPYIPAPPSPQSNRTTPQSQIPGNPTGTNGGFTEMQADLHPIDGSTIQFGTETIILTDGKGNGQDLSRTHNHILSSGRLVSKIDDVAGVCKICQVTAMEQYQAGEITLEAAQVASLYDTGSAAKCDTCGFQGCSIHVRPVQTEEGQVQLCVHCQRKRRIEQIKQFFLGPISETEGDQK